MVGGVDPYELDFYIDISYPAVSLTDWPEGPVNKSELNKGGRGRDTGARIGLNSEGAYRALGDIKNRIVGMGRKGGNLGAGSRRSIPDPAIIEGRGQGRDIRTI